MSTENNQNDNCLKPKSSILSKIWIHQIWIWERRINQIGKFYELKTWVIFSSVKSNRQKYPIIARSFSLCTERLFLMQKTLVSFLLLFKMHPENSIHCLVLKVHQSFKIAFNNCHSPIFVGGKTSLLYSRKWKKLLMIIVLRTKSFDSFWIVSQTFYVKSSPAS